MGLFSHFKKNNGYFSKNIEPKCSYCEHGKPARSAGKILCPRCGIVDENFSCKKFTYSPFLRIPEKDVKNTDTAPEKTTVQDQPETNKPKKTNDVPNDVASPHTIPNESENRENIPDNSSQSKLEETVTETVQNIKTETKKEASPENKVDKISNINNKPSDSSDRIAKLETIEKTAVASIENHVLPKEINLPEVMSNAVTSIENKPLKRDSEGYLKTISVKAVFEFENKKSSVHHIPTDTKTATIGEINADK